MSDPAVEAVAEAIDHHIRTASTFEEVADAAIAAMHAVAPVRLDIPHRDGCNRQLIVIDETYLRRHRDLTLVQSRDKRGYRHPHGWRNWLTLICNDIECPAVVLVRCDAIEAIATAATDG